MRRTCSRFFRFFAWVIPLATGMQAYSQENPVPGAQVPHFDTNYIQDYTYLLTARIYLLNQDASFVFTEGTNEQIVYKPNVNVRVGLAAFYKWFGLGLSIKNPVFEKSPDRFGKTTSIDWRINAYGRQYAAELFYQNYHGLYINSPTAPDGSLYKIPDMRMSSIGVTGYWIYNYKRFSIRAAFIQIERQKKSAGSLIISPYVSYYSLNSSDGIVPSELRAAYTIHLDDVIKNGNFIAIGLAPGYSYTVVFLKNFYINGALFPGVYWQSSYYTTLEGSRASRDFAFYLNTRLAAGFNSGKWFIGASVISGLNDVPAYIKGSKFYYDIAQMRFWAGTRFDWFRKNAKKM